MESEFDPAVRTEETPAARIVEIELPGFRREDLRVQINNRGSLVISGERGAKEMDDMTKVGGRSEKSRRVGQSFKKVISVPENLNFDGVTAKFRDERLRVSLPLLHASDQQNKDTVPGSGKPDQLPQSKVKSSSPAGQEDSRKERPAPAQDDQGARHPEAIRKDDDREKPTVAAEKSNELLEDKKTVAPKQTEEFVGEPPVSTHAQAVSDETGSVNHSESIQSKSKAEDESTLLQEDGGQKSGKPPEHRHLPQEKNKAGCADESTLLQEDGGQKSGKPPEHRHLPQEKNKAGCAEEGKAAEKDHDVVGKEGNGDGVGNIRHQREGKKDVEKRSSWRTQKIPHQQRIPFSASCSSTFSKRGVLIASSVVVLSVGFYITYKSRSRHHI